MRTTFQRLLFCLLLAVISSAHANDQITARTHESTPADSSAITKVTEDFRTGIINKDYLRLSSLMLNSNILFASPADAEGIKITRKMMDVNFDGVLAGGLKDFLTYLFKEKKPVEEKFQNLKITQDGNVAWAMFDYEFLVDGKVENYGIETWQLMKNADGEWKILSVVWSSHPI